VSAAASRGVDVEVNQERQVGIAIAWSSCEFEAIPSPRGMVACENPTPKGKEGGRRGGFFFLGRGDNKNKIAEAVKNAWPDISG